MNSTTLFYVIKPQCSVLEEPHCCIFLKLVFFNYSWNSSILTLSSSCTDLLFVFFLFYSFVWLSTCVSISFTWRSPTTIKNSLIKPHITPHGVGLWGQNSPSAALLYFSLHKFGWCRTFSLLFPFMKLVLHLLRTHNQFILNLWLMCTL